MGVSSLKTTAESMFRMYYELSYSLVDLVELLWALKNINPMSN